MGNTRNPADFAGLPSETGETAAKPLSNAGPAGVDVAVGEAEAENAVQARTRVRRIPEGEFTRKALHMLPGLFPFILATIPHPDPLDLESIGFVAQICVVLTVGFLLLHRIVKRPDETNLLSTTLSYPLTILAMLALFRGHAEFTTAVVAVLAFGDGAAYFGGKLFGKTPLPWNEKKTWAGTAAFVAFAAPIASLAYWVEARNPESTMLMAALCGTSAAVCGALAESVRTEITDNLRVGVFASLGVIAAHYTFAGLLLG